MSRIVESLYRVSGIKLYESENQYFEENIYNNIPKNVRLKDGYVFKIPYNDDLKFKSGDIAYKHIYIPFVSEKDAIDFARKNNISKDNITLSDNGDIVIEYYKSFKVDLIGHVVNYVVNQYEGHKTNNIFDNFPLKMRNVMYYIGDTKKDLIEEAKLANNNIKWPNNVGISSIEYLYYVFMIKEIKE